MWNKPHFLVCLLVLIPFSLGNTGDPSISEVLQTNQYVLVSQQDSFTLVETDVPPGKCPEVFKPKTNHPEKIRYVGFHLVRDPLGRHPPRIMVIRRLQSSLNINLYALNATSLFNINGPRKLAEFVDRTTSISMVHLYLKHENMVNSLFDSTNRMLYLDFSTKGNLEYEYYHVRDLFGDKLNLSLMNSGNRQSPIYRFDWTEDHYAGMFYYKETVDNEVSLFKLPMGSLLSTILEGESGRKVGKLPSEGKLLGATGGAFFSVDISREDNVSCTTSFVPVSLVNSGVQCKVQRPVNELPAFYDLVVIRDHDFCILRDGGNYNRESCDAERRDFLISAGMMAQSDIQQTESDDAVRWLLVFCLILFMIIVLQFVYIYWLRSTFVSDYDRTHHNEYETEASLFVAKQRSFPSAFQDPALMDVSVDKWN